MNDLPRHVAIIMDGNGRWARARGLPRAAGHAAGREAIRRVVRAAVRSGVPWLTLYAFSTENWRRPPEEVELLMQLFEDVLLTETPKLAREGVRIRVIGERSGLPASLVEAIEFAEAATQKNDRLNLVAALNYGGRREILRAVERLVAEGLEPTEENLRRGFYLPQMPDPDLVVRTGGELRVSNFLLWQTAYAELWVTEKYWPDFDENDFFAALRAYQKRERRFGGVPQG